MSNFYRNILALTLVIFTMATLAKPALAQPNTKSQPPDTIIIASKTFPESRILAELIAQAIESQTALKVIRKFGLEGTMVCHQAMLNGQVDIYPEYTGTGLVTILGKGLAQATPLHTYLTVKNEYLTRFNLVWLEPFGFNNTYALAVPKTLSEKLGLETISDLRPYQATLRLGVSHEFLNRVDGYLGVKKAYRLNFNSVRGLEHSLAYQAISSDNIDITDAYSTDGELLRYNLVLLKDDRGFFPPYHAAPLVRKEVLKSHPEIAEALHKLAWQLDDDKMRELNYKVQEKEATIPEVAAAFLQEINLPQTQAGHKQHLNTSSNSKIESQIATTAKLTWEHLVLVGLSLGLAILVGVPLGIFISQRPHLARSVLSAAGIIQTIPSIALLAFFIAIPGLGLGVRSAVMALFLYALLPIVRNSYTGILQVEPRLLEAACGIGLTDRQILRFVKLPLAAKTIMAGIRTSAVINVGVATLAAFIGAGGLGEPIVTGLQLNDPYLILTGAIPAAALAVAVDKLLAIIEGHLTPDYSEQN